jgi:hypothetical protein
MFGNDYRINYSGYSKDNQFHFDITSGNENIAKLNFQFIINYFSFDFCNLQQ